MEFKSLECFVLIVPLWNWNTILPEGGGGYAGFNCTFMELKSEESELLIVATKSFNCTFMELKYTASERSETLILVLIVPLWNWNSEGLVRGNYFDGSNCTFMELKFSSRMYY